MASTFLETIVQRIEDAYPVVKASQYLTLAGCTVLTYDYFLTFAKEVELIWKAPLSTISVIYLVNRYTIPLLLAVDIYDRLGLQNPTNVQFCNIWVWIEGYITLFSFMSMHALVAMRVHALHGGPKRLKVLLWACGIMYAIPTMIILGLGLYQGHHTMIIAPFFNVCYEELSDLMWTVWIPSLFYELLLFSLTVAKAIDEARRRIYSPITSILYRDGILYFIAIAGCSLFSMFVWLLGPMEMEGLAKYFATAIVNVAGCRLVISLKANARALQIVRARSTRAAGQSSSFVAGSETTFPVFAVDEYIMLEELSETSQLGTIYPPKPVQCWEAI